MMFTETVAVYVARQTHSAGKMLLILEKQPLFCKWEREVGIFLYTFKRPHTYWDEFPFLLSRTVL